MITLYVTQRGFVRGDFTDLYGSQCSIQESSLASQAALWLGVHAPSAAYKETESSRMHISQEMATALIPLLRHFVDNGTLPFFGEGETDG